MYLDVDPPGTHDPAPTPRPRRRRSSALYFGPAFVVAVAYVDPGNLATNVSAGAEFGYSLLWVIVLANLIAMLVQFLSAKLGLVTGRSLAEHCRERYSRPVVVALWVQAEIMVIMTDLAEVVGGALALYLLFGIPLVQGAVITVLAMLALLAIGRGRRGLQAVIATLLLVVLIAFVIEMSFTGIDTRAAAAGLVPQLADSRAALLAVGIVGATVMPHAIYLHSALTQDVSVVHRSPRVQRRAIRSTLVDIVVALSIAGCVNIAILVGGTALSSMNGDSLTDAYQAFGALIGPAAAVTFAIALLASGLAASAVGVYSGQVVMQGFIRRAIPVWLRRVVSLAPAFALLMVGVNPTTALVLSQVVLSFGVPFALIPLVRLTGDPVVMGDQTNGPWVHRAAILAAALVVALNGYLLITFLAP